VSTPIQYLALGDSYTIGTGATSESCNFPSILSRELAQATGTQVTLTNPAVNGFTTLDLIAKELDRINGLKPDVVSVLIGVNDLVQNRSAEEYKGSLTTIYDRIDAMHLAPECVASISIPNWSVVPAAAQYGEPRLIKAVTNDFNAIARKEALERGFTWVDITGVSTYRLGSPGWIAADELHPGDAQYQAWAEVIWAAVKESWTSVVARR
jgi:acyl-CoA thioesterase I